MKTVGYESGSVRPPRAPTWLIEGATSEAVMRWSRHSEMPRPMRAMPIGTAMGRLND